MKLSRVLPAILMCGVPSAALAQTSYLSPDGRNRFPGVTIFCPSGTGVAPCSFGGGGGAGGGAVSINLGGTAVSASNRLPVSDPALDSLISGGALSIAGMVGLSGTPTVNLGAGTNAIGSVSIANFPATQPVSGAVSISNFPATQPVSGAVSISNFPATQPISGSVAQQGSWTVGLQAGSTVAVTNLPATQPVSAAALPLPAGAATAAAQTASLGPIAPAAATATNSMVVGCTANTALPSFAAGQQGAVPCDTSGRLYVVSVPSSNNVPGYLQAVSSGGASVYRAINAASSAMAANVKGNTGMVYGYEACNSGSSVAYLRLFALGATPTVGTSTPQIAKVLPAGVCQGYSTDVGLVFGGGIGVDATSGSLADGDTAVIAAANQVSVQIYYK